MSEAEPGGEETGAPAKKGGVLMPLIFGLVGALVLGGGAAFTVSSGLVDIPGVTDGGGEKEEKAEKKPKVEAPKPAFVALEPLSIGLFHQGRPRTLRLTLMLESTEESVAEVETYVPRVLDALNTLMRAIDEQDLADPSALDRLRAQMLRRIRLVTDGAPVNDLLVVEYIVL